MAILAILANDSIDMAANAEALKSDWRHEATTNEKQFSNPSDKDEFQIRQPADTSTSRASLNRLETTLLMSALSLANLLVALDTTITTTALPVISAHFHSSAGYAWVGSAYILATAVTSPIWAKLSDIWGRKPLLLLSVTLFFLGSLLCGIAVSMYMLMIARAVQGLGGGGISILVTICISDTFCMRERPIYFGIFGMTWALASAIGPLMGGILTTKASWRWCFFINLPCAALCFPIVMFELNIHTPKTQVWEGLKAVDWIGSIFMVSGSVLLLLGLQMGGVDHPWSSPIILSLLVVGMFLTILFVLVEWKIAKYPLMPTRTFNNRSNLGSLGVACFHSMALTGGSYFLPLYFQGVLGASSLMSGVYLLPLTISLSVVNCIVGIVVRKTGKYILAMRISTIIMVFGLGLFIDLPATHDWPRLVIFQLLVGIGIGPNFQCPLIALQATTPQADHAAASSTATFLRNLSASVAIVATTAIFQNGMQSQNAQLEARLDSKVASLLTGVNAAANVEIIDLLPIDQRDFVRKAFLKGMLGMWIMFLAFGVGAFVCSLLVKKKILSEEHRITETGLEAERAKRELEMARRRVLKEAKVFGSNSNNEAKDRTRLDFRG